jgi:hypothetical protein
MNKYIPINRHQPKLANVGSAWGNIPSILKDIIDRFNLNQNSALEFGVEYGYSTSALANYFTNVIGVDTFEGDPHSGFKQNHLDITAGNLTDFNNIKLVKSDYKDYIKDNNNMYDMIHIDIIHNYDETFECGEWAINHSKCVIFHDTLSFSSIMKVCLDLSSKYNLEFHNYEESHGLGILINNSL